MEVSEGRNKRSKKLPKGKGVNVQEKHNMLVGYH